MLNEPERSIILALCRQWERAALEKRVSWEAPGQDRTEYQGVVLSLAPEVSFSRIDSQAEAETRYPFLIENLGDEPIWNLSLRIEPGPGKYLVRNKEPFNYPHPLLPGECIIHCFDLIVSESTTATAVLEYECPVLCGPFTLPFQVLRGDEGLRAKGAVRNPYLPDRPLRYSQELKDFENIPSRLRASTDIRTTLVDRGGEGLWISLYGLRRIGKTSLLYRLENELPDLGKEALPTGDKTPKLEYVPVYIDCFSLRAQEQWDEEGVLRFIADVIRYEVQDRVPMANSIWPTDANPVLAFQQFIRAAYEDMGHDKRLVIMLDEADLLGEPPFDTFALQLLFDLQNLTRSTVPGFSLILATERAMGDVWADFAEPEEQQEGSPPKRAGDKLFPVGMRLPLLALEEEEVKELANKVPELQYSDLALKYLWRVTGGYPSLVQAICYYIVKDRLARQKSAVTLPVVRRIVDNFIRNKDAHPYINYLELGFTPSEWELLEGLVWGRYGRVDASSMWIQVKEQEEAQRRDDLFSLAKKEVIEEPTLMGEQGEIGWRKLRVGFFKLWIEATRGRKRRKKQPANLETDPPSPTESVKVSESPLVP